MLLRLLIPILIAIPLVVLQQTLIPMVSVYGIVPDLVLILLVFYSVRNGQIFGTLLGFGLGIIMDLSSGGVLGSAMFAKTLSGFVAGYFYNENNVIENTSSYRFVMILFLCSIIDSFFYSVFGVKELELSFFSLFMEAAILPATYTALIGLPLILFNMGRADQ